MLKVVHQHFKHPDKTGKGWKGWKLEGYKGHKVMGKSDLI